MLSFVGLYIILDSENPTMQVKLREMLESIFKLFESNGPEYTIFECLDIFRGWKLHKKASNRQKYIVSPDHPGSFIFPVDIAERPHEAFLDKGDRFRNL